jgi:soluble lytic murein transglycosylase-like protein
MMLPGNHDEFDDLLRAAVAKREEDRHYDWLQIKAQMLQESTTGRGAQRRVDPRAQSSPGARGLMQIMPATGLVDLALYGKASEDELRAKKREAEADGWARFFDPETSIRAGLEYMVRQQRFFRDVVSPIPRWFFCLAAYNAGAGNVIRAQREARGLDWDGSDYHMMAACLPRITGQHAAETLVYVTRILEYYKALLAVYGAAPGSTGQGEPR